MTNENPRRGGNTAGAMLIDQIEQQQFIASSSAFQSHTAFVVAKRNVALADDKLRAVQDEALRLNPFVVSGEIRKPEAVDALCDIASSNGLSPTQRRREEIEHIIGMGLNGITTLFPVTGAETQQSAHKAHGSASQERNAPPLSRALVVFCAADVIPEKVEWVWQSRIARGKHTTIAGDPGTGKSQLLLSIAATVTTGGDWPCQEGSARLGSVILLCAEDGLADTIIPRLLAAGADPSRVHIVTAAGTEDGKGSQSFNLQSDLDLLEQKIKEIGDVQLIGIDPVSSYMGGGVDSHKNADVRRVLAPIGEMAERTGVAVVTVTHFSKSGTGISTKVLYRFIGSIAFTAAPRAAFVVMEDPDDKDRRLFLHGKNNLAKPPQGLAFRLAQRIVGGDKDILASRVVWDSQPVTVTADEVLGGCNNQPTAQDDAVEFLRKVLVDGPTLVKEIERQAVEAGLLGHGKLISQSKPFRMARKDLGIVAEKDGMQGGWTWRLPKMPSEAEDAL